MNESKRQSFDQQAQADNPQGFDQQLGNARMLVARLERLSADSYWAHQASGLRGSLLRCLEQVRESQAIDTDGSADKQIEKLDQLVDKGFAILVRAAREVSGGS